MSFQLGFGLHVVQKKTSVVCWRWQQWGLGYIAAQFQTPPGESPNVDSNRESQTFSWSSDQLIVLEMIIFRLQPFKTLREVIMHHQNCVVLNNSQVLVREAPPPSENGIEFKVANPLLTRRQLFSLVFSLSQISRISSLGSVMVTAKSTLDLRAERCRPSLGSVVVIPKSTLDLRAERCESCRKWQESNNKKAQQMGGTKNPAKVTE